MLLARSRGHARRGGSRSRNALNVSAQGRDRCGPQENQLSGRPRPSLSLLSEAYPEKPESPTPNFQHFRRRIADLVENKSLPAAASSTTRFQEYNTGLQQMGPPRLFAGMFSGSHPQGISSFGPRRPPPPEVEAERPRRPSFSDTKGAPGQEVQRNPWPPPYGLDTHLASNKFRSTAAGHLAGPLWFRPGPTWIVYSGPPAVSSRFRETTASPVLVIIEVVALVRCDPPTSCLCFPEARPRSVILVIPIFFPHSFRSLTCRVEFCGGVGSRGVPVTRA